MRREPAITYPSAGPWAPTTPRPPWWRASVARTVSEPSSTSSPGAISRTASKPRRRSRRPPPRGTTIGTRAADLPQRRQVEVVAVQVRDQHGVDVAQRGGRRRAARAAAGAPRGRAAAGRSGAARRRARRARCRARSTSPVPSAQGMLLPPGTSRVAWKSAKPVRFRRCPATVMPPRGDKPGRLLRVVVESSEEGLPRAPALESRVLRSRGVHMRKLESAVAILAVAALALPGAASAAYPVKITTPAGLDHAYGEAGEDRLAVADLDRGSLRGRRRPAGARGRRPVVVPRIGAEDEALGLHAQRRGDRQVQARPRDHLERQRRQARQAPESPQDPGHARARGGQARRRLRADQPDRPRDRARAEGEGRRRA